MSGTLPVRSSWVVSMAAALAIVGFAAAAQWNSFLERHAFTTSAQQALSAQVVQLEAEQESLLSQLAAAQAELQRLQAEDAGSQTALAEVNRRLADTRLAAGLSRIHGPGVRVEIADSLRNVPAGENPASYIVQPDDLRDLVAALWASGAEGISINGERLVATSSIYGVGASVLVNTAFLSPPFEVAAVGPPDLEQAMETNPAYLGRVARRIDIFGLQFRISSEADIELPAFIGNTLLRWAVPDQDVG